MDEVEARFSRKRKGERDVWVDVGGIGWFNGVEESVGGVDERFLQYY